MSDDDLVKRLRAQAASRSGTADVMSDGSIVWHPLMIEAADAIERLTQERGEARGESLRWQNGCNAALDRAEAAERKVEKLRAALYPFAAPSEHYYEDFADHETLRVQLPAGWVRRARAALAETENGDDGRAAAFAETEECK